MDVFHGHSTSLTGPARHAAALSPSENRLAQVTRAIYVGATGDIDVELAGGDRVVFEGVHGGTLLPVRAVRVLPEGTTAGAILALW